MKTQAFSTFSSVQRIVVSLGLIFAFSAGAAHAYTGQALEQQASIKIEQARAIALKAFPGKISDEELEQEHGGSGLRYSFDIQYEKGTQEVGVDAKTGKVLENTLEGRHPD